MATRVRVAILPVDVRRQLWAQLWRDVLLKPRPLPPPPTPPQDDDDRSDEAA